MFPDPALVVSFALAVTAIVVSPGPDTMLILRSALSAGRAAGFAAIAGVQLGLVVHTTLAAVGVSALIASSSLMLTALAVAGACYLAWLGAQSFRGGTKLALAAGHTISPGRACRDALVCNVLNPKVIILFLALYPNFIIAEKGHVALQIAILSAVLLLINLVWQTGLVLCTDVARRWLTDPAIQRAVGRLTGGILLVFAAAMLWERIA
jgi:threonine/homoserine/homoserine lactone efflux protein